MALVYLGMGSNLGFRREQLGEGVRRLRRWGCVVQVSSVLETEPVGPQDQPAYLNGVVEFGTEFAPLTLLRGVKEIERQVGRRPTYRWGPRILDIDLLLYDDLKWSSPVLILPHPRMAEREFVMGPLAEIGPDVAASVKNLTGGLK